MSEDVHNEAADLVHTKGAPHKRLTLSVSSGVGGGHMQWGSPQVAKGCQGQDRME